MKIYFFMMMFLAFFMCFTGPMCPMKNEICDNGVDDNGDGDVDCDDVQCVEAINCQPEVCDNNVDDNGDGSVDCNDPECFSAPQCSDEVCDNGKDDDGDGFIDCKDFNCSCGTLIFNEFMYNPEKSQDQYGEYIELCNPTDEHVDVHGWIVEDGSASGDFLFIGKIIPAHSCFLIAKSMDSTLNGGIQPDAPFNFSLNNDVDTLSLYNKAKELVQKVQYTNPCLSGSAYEYCASTNKWACVKQKVENKYGAGDYGTPGAPNTCL